VLAAPLQLQGVVELRGLDEAAAEEELAQGSAFEGGHGEE
jgi:hypothetical protein